MKTKYTRKQLIEICEKASVPESSWNNRDSERAQCQVGEIWALLRAGCRFRVIHDKDLCTSDRTIWVKVWSKGFGYCEGGAMKETTFYLPTKERMAENPNEDWY